MQIAIITGEASGDRVGAQLAQEIRRLLPDATLWGSGGAYLKRAGVDVVVDSSRFGVVGIVSGMQMLPQVMRTRATLFAAMRERKPDIVVPVDAGAFNLGFAGLEGMCPFLRRTLPDTKIFYYFPPGSWRRTLTRTSLDKNADMVATPFPWSADELNRLGARAVFVGHPLLDIVKPMRTPTQFADKFGIDLERPVVGLLPGSRSGELAEMLPTLLSAAAIIHRRIAGAQFVLALAATVSREQIIKDIERWRETGYTSTERADAAAKRRVEERKRDSDGAVDAAQDENSAERPTAPLITTSGHIVAPEELERQQRDWKRRLQAQTQATTGGDTNFPLVLVEDATYDVMAASDALLTASGTATLEAAILGRPMVILYKMSAWNRPQYLLVKNKLPRFVGLPNLLADREICPEFLQEVATPDALAGAVIGLLLEPDRIAQQRADLRKVVALLGEPGGAARAAGLLVDLSNERVIRSA